MTWSATVAHVAWAAAAFGTCAIEPGVPIVGMLVAAWLWDRRDDDA